MRKIKFRAWDGIRMTTSGITFSNSTGEVCASAYGPEGNEHHMPLMQYTGLKDKSGVEIYEGDVLAIHGVPTPVTYSDAKFYAKKNGERYSLGGWDMDVVKVIGNIYENPELLEPVSN